MTKQTPMSETAEIIAFLRGEGPLEGKHFGDKDERGRAFWWRRHLDRITHTTPSDPVLRWEGEDLWLGQIRIAQAFQSLSKPDKWVWDTMLTDPIRYAPTEAEAKTAAEQAVRDWLKRAGLV